MKYRLGTKNRKTEKTNKTKTSFFEKIHIIDKASIRLTKEKRIQINKNLNLKGVSTTDITERNIIDDYEQL